VTMRLRQVVYLSRASATCDDEQVYELSRASRERNQAYDVTGLLLYDGSRFIQAIEGPHDAIEETMDRITKDDRHTSIEIATDRVIEHRQFGDWSLQSRKATAGACSASFLKKIKQLMDNVDDAALQALFIGFTVLGSARNKAR
jgi:hypothetical protein